MVANIVPKNGKTTPKLKFLFLQQWCLTFTAMCEEGLLALQSLLEGMMLEVHITGWAATADDSSTLTVAEVEASQTDDNGETPMTKASLPMVELYTQFGSQVRRLCVCKYKWEAVRRAGGESMSIKHG